MIIEARKVQTVDVEIDPVNVIRHLYEMWVVAKGMPPDASIAAGIWQTNDSFIRQATEREIKIANSFFIVEQIADDWEL